MRIYIAHPTDIDYKNEIYEPLRNDSLFALHEFILPHEKSNIIMNTRDDYKNIDIVIAECSKPSIGVGIELGWFYDEKKPIHCFYKCGTNPSMALTKISKEIFEYNDEHDLIDKIRRVVESFSTR